MRIILLVASVSVLTIVAGPLGISAGVDDQDRSTALLKNETPGHQLLTRPPGKKDASFGQTRLRIAGRIDDLIVADFNDDGYSDVAIVDYDAHLVRVFLGDKKLEFKKQFEKKLNDIGDLFAGAADFTGDGKLDLAVENKSSDKYFSIFPGKGDGSMGKAKTIRAEQTSYGDFYYATTMDFNGDGRPDIVGVKLGGTLFAFRNLGKNKFDIHEIPDKTGDDGLAAGDFSGDGVDDFFVGDVISDKIFFYRSDGDGTFTQAGSTNVKDCGYGLYTADLNKDGKLDMIGASYYSSPAWTMLGKGKGKLVKKKGLPSDGTLRYGIACADFTGDGKMDIASAEKYGIYLYPGKRGGKFSSPSVLGGSLYFNRYGSVSGSSNIGYGDFNNDGKPDIIGAQYFGTTSNPRSNLVLFMSGGKPASLTISNLQVTRLSFSLMVVNFSGSVDFSGSNIDLRYNGNYEDPTDNAFLMVTVRVDMPWPFSDFVGTYANTGENLHRPGVDSGTINFDMTLPTSVMIIGAQPSVSLSSFYLIDNNLVQSNRLD